MHDVDTEFYTTVIREMASQSILAVEVMVLPGIVWVWRLRKAEEWP
jgi:hypothetical protein